jgi:hypothetical protein
MEFKPSFDCEYDDVIIKVDSKILELLKKVAITKDAELINEEVSNSETCYDRYKVKRFITQNYGNPYLMLFDKTLIDTGTATFKSTYRSFLYLLRDFKSTNFTQFLSDVANYGEKKVIINVDINEDKAKGV